MSSSPIQYHNALQSAGMLDDSDEKMTREERIRHTENRPRQTIEVVIYNPQREWVPLDHTSYPHASFGDKLASSNSSAVDAKHDEDSDGLAGLASARWSSLRSRNSSKVGQQETPSKMATKGIDLRTILPSSKIPSLRNAEERTTSPGGPAAKYGDHGLRPRAMDTGSEFSPKTRVTRSRTALASNSVLGNLRSASCPAQRLQPLRTSARQNGLQNDDDVANVRVKGCPSFNRGRSRTAINLRTSAEVISVVQEIGERFSETRTEGTPKNGRNREDSKQSRAKDDTIYSGKSSARPSPVAKDLSRSARALFQARNCLGRFAKNSRLGPDNTATRSQSLFQIRQDWTQKPTTGESLGRDSDGKNEAVSTSVPSTQRRHSVRISRKASAGEDIDELETNRNTPAWLEINQRGPSVSRVKESAILPLPVRHTSLATFSQASTLPDSPSSKAEPAKPKKQPLKSPFFPPILPGSKPRREDKNGFTDQAQTIELKTPKKGKNSSPSKATPKRSPGGIISCIPFPPLAAPHFGLIQEKLAHDPFRLLIAVTFLIRTHGKHAIPVFFELMQKYPTPESLAAADIEDIVNIVRHLGLQNQRALTYQTYAKTWLENPPAKGKRYPVRGYPEKESGRDVKKDEILSDADERDAWEIAHMVQGPYALDSWRIFCRDKLRGLATGWNGEGTEQDGFQPEWMRVLPDDKELRACLRWMWLKEGFEWDPVTGEKEVAGEELVRAAMEGRVTWDEKGGMRTVEAGEGGWRGGMHGLGAGDGDLDMQDMV